MDERNLGLVPTDGADVFTADWQDEKLFVMAADKQIDDKSFFYP